MLELESTSVRGVPEPWDGVSQGSELSVPSAWDIVSQTLDDFLGLWFNGKSCGVKRKKSLILFSCNKTENSISLIS